MGGFGNECVSIVLRNMENELLASNDTEQPVGNSTN